MNFTKGFIKDLCHAKWVVALFENTLFEETYGRMIYTYANK